MSDEAVSPAEPSAPISAQVVKKSHHAKPPVARPRSPAATAAPAAVAAVATPAVPVAAAATATASADKLESAVDAALSVFGWD